MGEVEKGKGRKPRKTPTQPPLPAPGMARTHHPDIEKAADSFQDAAGEAKELREATKHRMGVLRQLMARHKLEMLRLDDGRIVRVQAGVDKVKIDKPKKARGKGRRGRW